MLSTTSKFSWLFAILILTDLPNALVCVPVAQEIPWTRLLPEAALSHKADALNREFTDYICSLQATDPEELFK
ncbi:hypothetical protein X801_03185, partial [Opisthorchis viverrini]